MNADPTSTPTPIAPPTVPGPISTPRRRLAWPDWIGAVWIAIGCIQIFYSLLTEASLTIFRGSSAVNFHRYEWAIRVDDAIGVLLGGWSIALGVMLLRRSPRAFPQSTYWSIARLATGTFTLIVWAAGQHEQMRIMSANGSLKVSNPSMLDVAFVAGVLLNAVLQYGPAVFLLLWMRSHRPKA